MDVRTTFLNGDLVEDVYMSQPTYDAPNPGVSR